MSGVRWPAKAYDAEGDDLSEPMQQLLIDLRLLQKPGEKAGDGKAADAKTPDSVQVITSGATGLSQLVAKGIGYVGGAAAFATGLGGFFLTFLGDDGADVPLTRSAFLVSGAIVATAVVLSLALVVRADVQARATATASQYDARAAVATALLRSYVAPPAPPVAAPPQYAVQDEDGAWAAVSAFEWRGGSNATRRLVALCDGDVKPMAEWTGLVRLDQVLTD